MDKPLSDKKNIDSTVQTEAPVSPSAAPKPASPSFVANPKIDFATAEIGAYNKDISKKLWDKAEKEPEPWANDPKKRLAIRAISRGVLGAVFFTAGGLYASKAMKSYDASKGLVEQKNPLQVIAKSIDTFVGKSIEFLVNAYGGAGKNAVRFRSTNWSRNDDWGRSLGDEVVKITFDFFSASIGDAFGRDLMAFIDPNVRHSKDPNIRQSWLDEKGNIKAPEAVKSLMKTAWRYVSYNGGEDWAVAIPYAYFIKAQRNVISKFSPEFRLDSDRAGNGAGFVLKSSLQPDGKYKSEVVGNFNKEGAVDFQGRFTAYNILTLMYREAYHFVANKWKGNPDSLYGAPDAPEEKRGVLGTAGHLAKWFARSVVKGLIVMTPSVPFFWITRVPQSAYKSTFIDPELGHLSHVINTETGRRGAVHTDFIKDGKVSIDDATFRLAKYDGSLRATGEAPFRRKDFDAHSFEPLVAGENFDPYKKSFGPIDRVFNTIGKASDRLALSLDEPARSFEERFPHFAKSTKNALGMKKITEFSRGYVNAAVSYTPYMHAKAEFGNMWDNGKTDLAAERMIDGAAHLNFSEFKAGLSELGAAVLHEPFADPVREKEAKRRIRVDTSAVETFDRQQEDIEQREDELARKLHHKPVHEIPWRDRLFSAPKPVKKEPEAYKKSAHVPEKSEGHTQREEMRKALEELQPPTSSIN